jgi:hypothetical protein
METQHTNCCATVLLRYYGNATGCIGHVTKENPICHNIYNIKDGFASQWTTHCACVLHVLISDVEE